MIKTMLIVGTGGFLGTISRFLLSRYIQQLWPSYIPYGTLIVNVLGCFLIGVLYGISERTQMFGSEWRFFLTVGFCGAFTTFSTFTNENMILLRDQEYFLSFLYIALSLILGLGATFTGHIFTKSI